MSFLRRDRSRSQLFGNDGNPAGAESGHSPDQIKFPDPASRKPPYSPLGSSPSTSSNNLKNITQHQPFPNQNQQNQQGAGAPAQTRQSNLSNQNSATNLHSAGLRSSLSNSTPTIPETSQPQSQLGASRLTVMPKKLPGTHAAIVAPGLVTTPDSAILPHLKEFPTSLDQSDPQTGPGRLNHRPSESYSPRLSYANLQDAGKSGSSSTLKDDYQGFHKNPAHNANIPPLSHPIKPRFRKKGSLLGKLIHSNRKDLEGLIDTSEVSDSAASVQGGRRLHGGSSGSGPNAVAKHKFRIPLISLHHHASIINDASRQASLSEDLSDKFSEKLSGPPSKNSSVSGPAGSPSKIYDLNLNIEELSSILKPAADSGNLAKLGSFNDGSNSAITQSNQRINAHNSSLGDLREASHQSDGESPNAQHFGGVSHSQFDMDVANSDVRPGFLTRLSLDHVAPDHTDDIPRHSAWKAPDSWDVTEVGCHDTYDSDTTGLSDSDNDILNDQTYRDDEYPNLGGKNSGVGSPTSQNKPSSAGPEKTRRRNRIQPRPAVPEKKNATVFGIEKSSAHNMPIARGPNHIIRIFKEDNTFSTILCPVETTTTELLTIIQKKLFIDSMSNFQLTIYYGLHTKVLDLHEKPLKIQLGLLTTQGYSNRDNLPALGRGDMLSIYKFVIESISLRSLNHEDQPPYNRNYVDVHISSMGLKTIPIVFHQHTFEIEKLDVSHNPAIYIPLDFIQSCSNLTNINFLHNGSSRFPHNLLEALESLLQLDMSNNFLAEIPARCLHLRKLQTLRLNSNQLYFLHSNFCKLSNLTSLNLSLNYFEIYPECINKLTALQHLDLSYNDLNSVPLSIANLVCLTKLNLCSNKLRQLPNALSRLGALKRLDIRYNLIANIDVLGKLPNLEVVYASKNDISNFSDTMQALRLLKFDRNPITTLVFETLLPRLTVLDLSKAKIAALPSDFVMKIPNVETLNLDKNHLVTLPEEVGNLKRLSYFSAYDNNIQVLPASIGSMQSLLYLDLHSNNIEQLPSAIWNLGRLAYLNMSLNILESFPIAELNTSEDLQAKTLPLATSLQTLLIADNRLKEEAFEALSLLTNLRSLNVSYNDFVEVPDGALLQLVNISELHMLGNNLTKLPADAFENLLHLRSLFVNNNKLLTIPPELSNCKLLTHLDAGSNQLRYNISNWPYDWNWCHNKNLKYLNFSGNKRFEIKQLYTLAPEKDGYDSLLVLKNLRVLGLMDVTLTTPNVPDQGVNVRVRTTSSELRTVGYGVSDCMGPAECVSFRDSFLQKFRGVEDEVLICSFNGYNAASNHASSANSSDPSNSTGAAAAASGSGGNSEKNGQGHIILYICKQAFPLVFRQELDQVTSDDDIQDALRKAFLTLNRTINSVFAAKRAGTWQDLTPCSVNGEVIPELLQLSLASDIYKGCCMAVVYIKKSVVYTANIGDIEILLLRSNSDYTVLSTKHDPTSRAEFERIRSSGGYVSGDGALDLTVPVLRGIGFFGYVPHTNGCPSTSQYDLSGTEGIIIVALSCLWDYVLHDLAVDIVRQEKDDPMIAAERLRDHALCYGANDRISVTVISVGRIAPQTGSGYGTGPLSAGMVNRKGRRDRQMPSADTALRRLNDEIDPPVGNIALVFTDIKNSTLLWDTYPVAMRSAIKLHNTIMRRQLRIVGGYEVKTEGDSFMVSFPSAPSALLWCFNVQNQLLVEDWPQEILATNEGCEVTDNSGNIIFRGLSVRMGIHWGSPVCELDMVTRRMDYFGPMVNRASRIESSADGGQIAVSSDFLKEMDRAHNLAASAASTLQLDHIEGETPAPIVGALTSTSELGDHALSFDPDLAALSAIPYLYFVLGERKLKGLEAPETITLVFPDTLKIRYDIFKKRDMAAVLANQILGALPVEAIYSLRSLSLRLENICSILNTGYNGSDDSFSRLAGDIFVKSLSNNFREKDIVGLFNHLVTRLENCVAILELRQTHDKLKGGEGKVDFTGALPIWDLINDLSGLLMEGVPKTE